MDTLYSCYWLYPDWRMNTICDYAINACLIVVIMKYVNTYFLSVTIVNGNKDKNTITYANTVKTSYNTGIFPNFRIVHICQLITTRASQTFSLVFSFQYFLNQFIFLIYHRLLNNSLCVTESSYWNVLGTEGRTLLGASSHRHHNCRVDTTDLFDNSALRPSGYLT